MEGFIGEMIFWTCVLIGMKIVGIIEESKE